MKDKIPLKGIVTFMTVVFSVMPVAGQENVIAPDMQLQADIEEMMHTLKRSEDLSELLDYFSSLREHPVNINTAGREELEQLLFLNDFQISSLLEYRRETGPIYSAGELQTVFGFDREVIRRILPYITLGGDSGGSPAAGKTGRLSQEGIVRARAVAEEEAGFLPVSGEEMQAHPGRHYRGGPAGLYLRYQMHYGRKIYAGMTAENDPGEPFFAGENKSGFDFYSFYLQYRGKGLLRQVNAGRYALRFGQGLVIWNGFHMGKASRVDGIDKRAPEMRYASSATEYGYLNGVSAALQLGRFTMIPFFSANRADAHVLRTADSAGTFFFPSFLTTGLHRTAGELQNKRSVRQWLSGVRVSYRHRQLAVGVTSLWSALDIPLVPAGRPDQVFAFSGKENFNAGIDYTLGIKRVSLFGEAAVAKNGAPALLQGVQWYFSPLMSLSVLGRYYRRDYHAFYANAFSETGLTRNESGIYMGFTGHFIPRVALSGYVDLYHFLWLRYHADAPSQGTETRLTLSWEPAESFHADVQYISKSRTVNDPEAVTPMAGLVKQSRDHLRLQFRYLLLPQLQAVSRIDLTRFSPAPGRTPEKGFLVYQQLGYAPLRSPVTVYGRFGIFNTRFSTRIYTYENDLLYSFSTPSFTGRGIRWYVMVKYPLFSHGTLALRVARTSFAGRQSIGDGPAEINVPHKTEIKAQMRLKF